ncbi:MAG: ATP-binding cassette domain-containing protein [Campylobacterales bacterium]|nr:ATP-binding cassette domain-containing protein [Campylobacterales bacterium]
MSYINLQNISCSFDGFVLDKASLDIEKNDYFVLLGKSGSGKTLVLETIAGLNLVEGSVLFAGENITNLPPEKREVGFVYQDFALFPNLNVEENIKFAGRYSKEPHDEVYYQGLIDFLGLKKLLKRDVDGLSGGEKQRIAIARALYSKPKILLLDEPLSAIDPTLRNSIMKSLKEIHKHYNLTTIHVTHNFREASYLADKIAILIDGKVKQIGEVEEVLNSPASIDVAKFLGFKNIFSTELLEGEFDKKLFSVDPNVIHISNEPLETDFSFIGEVVECMKIIDHYKVFVNVGGDRFFIKVLKRDFKPSLDSLNQAIYIGFDKENISFI